MFFESYDEYTGPRRAIIMIEALCHLYYQNTKEAQKVILDEEFATDADDPVFAEWERRFIAGEDVFQGMRDRFSRDYRNFRKRIRSFTGMPDKSKPIRRKKAEVVDGGLYSADEVKFDDTAADAEDVNDTFAPIGE